MRFSYNKPPVGETKFDIKKTDYIRHYYECLCGHFFSHHSIDLTSIYSSEYLNKTYNDINGIYEKLRQVQLLPRHLSDNAGRVERINKMAANHEFPNKRLLDIGAGIGVFPSAMKENGWDVTAIESDKRMVEHLQSYVGVHAINNDILDLSPSDFLSFDVITWNKVLEHIEKPVDVLMQSARFLADRGFIYVEVPDAYAAKDGKNREEFFIEHHHIFSMKSVTHLAEESNLIVRQLQRVREPSGKYTIFAQLTK